jgi:transposase InsO family protein
LIKVVGIPRSTYYYYISRFEKPDKYEAVKTEITNICRENKERYGYRRVLLVLRSRGFIINHKTVQRLMKELGLVCRVRMKKYKLFRGDFAKIAPNLLNRNFVADAPNQKWVTDVVEFSLFNEKLHLSPILDLYNREIVSYSLSRYPNCAQLVDMLNKAFVKIPDNPNLILHSDQGFLYQGKTFRRMLAQKGIRQSMSRKGNCLDNTVIESFFSHVKSELFYLMKFSSMEHFKSELVDYLDYYNNRRIKAKLNGLSPVEYRIHALSPA